MFDSSEEVENLFQEINEFLTSPEQKQQGILTDDEMQTLLLSLGLSRDMEGFTEDEGYELIRWAENARIANTLLEMALDGSCLVNWKEGEPTFKLSEAGQEELLQTNGDNLQDA